MSKNVNYDAVYDVIVVGFGGAGATAARFAADKGAKVLLIDSAPEGHEGGNTRYAAQLIGSGKDFAGLKEYYQNLTAPMELDEKMVDTLVNGMVGMKDYLKKYLDNDSISMRETDPDGRGASVYGEYPEFAGVDSHDLRIVHPQIFDSALWKLLKEQVSKRSDKIDVLYSTPAQSLIQDPESKKITGVVLERRGEQLNVRAKNGVVLTLGGFENNQQYLEDFLGARRLAPLGTLYNNGDGIRMALEVGADLWHMHNFESAGMLHGMAFATKKHQRGRFLVGVQNYQVSHGSIFTIGDDGTRYFDESEENRHGHLKNHGLWKVPFNQVHPYLIFDEAKKKELDADRVIGQMSAYKEQLVAADSVAELAAALNVSATVLQETVATFNQAAQQQNDPEFHCDPSSMKPLQGKIYAAPLAQTILNTQGGPRRNAQAEVLDTKGQLIPQLYSAGEFGGINANQYQGGGNLAENLIFGKIAGENAATVKADAASESDAVSSPSQTETFKSLGSDDQAEKVAFETGPNQFIGRSTAGIGDEIVVRLTVDQEQKMQKIEVLQENESAEIGEQVLATLPEQMVAQNTVDVDAVAGASTTSRALKAAVQNALNQVK